MALASALQPTLAFRKQDDERNLVTDLGKGEVSGRLAELGLSRWLRGLSAAPHSQFLIELCRWRPETRTLGAWAGPRSVRDALPLLLAPFCLAAMLEL